jgi:hypothetical protein
MKNKYLVIPPKGYDCPCYVYANSREQAEEFVKNSFVEGSKVGDKIE